MIYRTDPLSGPPPSLAEREWCWGHISTDYARLAAVQLSPLDSIFRVVSTIDFVGEHEDKEVFVGMRGGHFEYNYNEHQHDLDNGRRKLESIKFDCYYLKFWMKMDLNRISETNPVDAMLT